MNYLHLHVTGTCCSSRGRRRRCSPLGLPEDGRDGTEPATRFCRGSAVKQREFTRCDRKRRFSTCACVKHLTTVGNRPQSETGCCIFNKPQAAVCVRVRVCGFSPECITSSQHLTVAAHERVISIYGNSVCKQGASARDRRMHPCCVYLCVCVCMSGVCSACVPAACTQILCSGGIWALIFSDAATADTPISFDGADASSEHWFPTKPVYFSATWSERETAPSQRSPRMSAQTDKTTHFNLGR